MRKQDDDDALTFLAGEDLSAGDLVALDPETHRVILCPEDTRCVVTVSQDYRAGEVVEFPSEGE
ncbi:MAG: hypothetical protein QM692_23720 [Thermomicrobiales bacterium]